MSEMINNREHQATNQASSAERQTMLKEIIKELHNGKTIDEVKAKFDHAVGDISVAEISALEQALMDEEGIPVAEVQRLCGVHAAVFKGSINEIHSNAKAEEQPGHPVAVFKQENREIDRLVNFTISLHMDRFQKDDSDENRMQLIEDFNLLYDVDKHYSRKENILFPFLEKYGIYGPTKVMWGVDDGIRLGIKEARAKLMQFDGNVDAWVALAQSVLHEVTDMIFKEEHILLPMALEKLTEDEWVKIMHDSDEIGYCLIAPEQKWIPARVAEPGPSEHTDQAETEPVMQEGFVRMETGILSIQQLELMMNHLPVDLTFIDEHDIVRYFSHGKERIFARTKAVIGRSVQNCHPPQSVHVVEKLLADFKSGAKDTEDFWIPFKDKFVYIRYFAVRDEQGRYVGTLEFTQNIQPIQQLEGQKRIMS